MAQCYYPNGSPAANDTPCNNSTSDSTCCGQGYACLTNHICMLPFPPTESQTKYVRGSCTDRTFMSSNCPRFCMNPQFDDTGGGEGIAKCQNISTDAYYCIDGNMNSTNCASGKNVLIFDGTPSVITTIGVTISNSATPNPTSTVSASSSSTSLNPLVTPDMTPSNSNNIAVGAGVGVGVSLLLISLAIAIFWLWWRRQRSGRQQTKAEPATCSYLLGFMDLLKRKKRTLELSLSPDKTALSELEAEDHRHELSTPSAKAKNGPQRVSALHSNTRRSRHELPA